MFRGHWRRILAACIPVGVGLLVSSGVGSAQRDNSTAPRIKPAPNPPAEVKHDVSPPLRSIPPKPKHARKDHEENKIPVPAGSGTPDPVVQGTQSSTSAPALTHNFAGIGVQDSAPPDTNGAVGPAHYVQIVNESFQVFSKSGTSIYGPVPTNTLWTNFGGGCEANNDGDATVEYDRLANRWIIQQFSVSTDPYLECIAVSTTGDPTGSWSRYAFGGFGTDFPDYPKLGVWPDAYYVTYNLFAFAASFDGPEVCAYDRAKMLLGQTATQKCFIVDNLNLGGLLPSDVDSATAPPAGSPNYVMAFDTGVLDLWKFHVDWTTPSNSTLTGPTSIPVAAFNPACNGGACVPQTGTTQKLDSLGDRLMYRLAYRNFGDHESLVVSHSVTAGSSVGTRWYELRNPNVTPPTVYQQGTYAPDSTYRWMGSVAMDGSGDIALGFSSSSASTHPGIHYTGRLAGDPLGVMTQGEGTIIDGGGSQNGLLDRWGDYSSMSIDPSDDCTFWYTNEYIPSNGSFNWQTRIASFSLPGCAAGVIDDFSLTPSPSSVTIGQGGSGGTTVNTAVTSGSAQTVSLSSSGEPFGTTVSFSPASVTAGGSSSMTIDVGSGTPVGTFPITVLGTGSSVSHTTTVNLTVTLANAVTNGTFEAGLTGWTSGGGFGPTIVSGGKPGGTQAAQLGSTAPFAGDSNLSQTVTVPNGRSQLTFWYVPRCRGSLATDQIQAQIRTTGGATLATILNVCSKTNKWKQITFDTSAYAGQTVVLWFNDHDNGSANTPTYFLLDNIALTTVTGSPVQNGGFESVDLSAWSPSGAEAPVISSHHHSGSSAVQLGSPTAFDGDSTVAQTVVIPAGSPKLAFWYQPHCADSVAYDQIQMQVRNGSGQIKSAVLNACSNSGNWTKGSFDMSPYAGQSVVLYFNVHDDGVADDPTYALFDDISLN
jgi:hypothetical protein